MDVWSIPAATFFTRQCRQLLALSFCLLASCVIRNPAFTEPDGQPVGDADGDGDADADEDADDRLDGDIEDDAADTDAESDEAYDADSDGTVDGDVCEATESCNGLDDDCDGVIPPDELDHDGDGVLQCNDCNDNDRWIHRCDCLAAGVGEGPVRIFTRDTKTLELRFSTLEEEATTSLAWADLDGDGLTDLAVGNQRDPTRIYHNDGHGSLVSDVTLDGAGAMALSWGRLTSAEPALAIANEHNANRAYVYTAAGFDERWSESPSLWSYGIAWGDVDGDGLDELALGLAGEPTRVYVNDGGTLAGYLTLGTARSARSVAWGDVDGDGDLDLAIGHIDDPLEIYRNDSGTLSLLWAAAAVTTIRSVAWSDFDDDGDAELAVGSTDAVTRVYDWTGSEVIEVWSGGQPANTRSVAWGDFDGDGLVDLAIGVEGGPLQVLRNVDGHDLVVGWSWIVEEPITSVAFGDCGW